MISKPHQVLIVAFAPAQILDVTGPLDVFAEANQACENAGMPPAYTIRLAAPEAGLVSTTSGVPLVASCDLEQSRNWADTLVISGGRGARYAAQDSAVVASIARLSAEAPRVAAICTGVWPLAATGQLNGRRVTTHWRYGEMLTKQHPQINVDTDAIFVRDGKYHCSAGVTAGIDLSLALVEHDLGRRSALEVARELVVYLRRPGGQSQFSAQLASDFDASDVDAFAELTNWIDSNLSADLSVPALAERVAMSPRNFTRRFTEAMGISPGRYVQRLRFDAARRMLSSGDVSISEVASACGFRRQNTLHQAFQRELKLAPLAFKARHDS